MFSFSPALKLPVLQLVLYINNTTNSKKNSLFVQERLVSVRACLPLFVTQQLLQAYRIGSKNLGFTVRVVSKLLVFLQADSLHVIFLLNFFFTFGLELFYMCV